MKRGFDTHAKTASAQLVSSARIIHVCRIKELSHYDVRELDSYCRRVCKAYKQNKDVLLQALLYGKLHFVLAFRFYEDPYQAMLSSGSFSAKHEMISTREEIGVINKDFEFHICPIQGYQG